MKAVWIHGPRCKFKHNLDTYKSSDKKGMSIDRGNLLVIIDLEMSY